MLAEGIGRIFINLNQRIQVKNKPLVFLLLFMLAALKTRAQTADSVPQVGPRKLL